jgi:ABC-type multidrug transport system ATPase subunit
MSDDAAESSVLAVEDLSVRYGRREVLRGLRLQVARGGVYALLGRNGAGKSSLVRCLLGLQKPSSGRVWLFGRDAWTDRRSAMARIGVVPEEPDAPPEMNAAQLVRFAGRFYDRWDAAGARERLDRFAVPSEVPFRSLSKGQKGAVMLALALAHAPELLVLDDPTLGLDVVARDAVFNEVIGELADRGTTVFVTSHDLSAIERLADRIGILRDGRLAVDEDTDALKARYAAPLEQIFTDVTAPAKEARA